MVWNLNKWRRRQTEAVPGTSNYIKRTKRNSSKMVTLCGWVNDRTSETAYDWPQQLWGTKLGYDYMVVLSSRQLLSIWNTLDCNKGAKEDYLAQDSNRNVNIPSRPLRNVSESNGGSLSETHFSTTQHMVWRQLWRQYRVWDSNLASSQSNFRGKLKTELFFALAFRYLIVLLFHCRWCCAFCTHIFYIATLKFFRTVRLVNAVRIYITLTRVG